MTVGSQPLNPAASPIVEPPTGVPNPMFGRWLDYVRRVIADPTSFFVSAPVALQNFANDAAAAAGGIVIGQLYRNGSVVQIRVT
jgi:hypothetical protein